MWLDTPDLVCVVLLRALLILVHGTYGLPTCMSHRKDKANSIVLGSSTQVTITRTRARI